LNEIVARNIDLAKQKRCDISVSAGPCWVKTDRSLLTNIMQNLVSNAIKYAPGKPISLRVETVGETVTVSVIDQGDGISASEIDAVFKEYYQVGMHDAQKADGLGLGLALVQKFSEILNLECTMTSDQAEGTQVQISRLKAVPAQKTGVIRGATRHHPLTDLKVHVVDDDPEILAATVRLLKRWGCIATSSTQIPQSKLGVDFLITDFYLRHGKNGKECIAQLRQTEGRYLPAIIVTGQQNFDLENLDISEPIGLIEKPASAQRIRSLMLSQLTKAKAMQPDKGPI
jgi:CheY-like chemotaxis protein